MSLVFTQITGTFEDGQGSPLSGSAAFTPNTTVYAAGIPVVEAGVPVAAQITGGALKNASGGVLQLLATDNAGLTYAGQTGFLFWTVTVTVAGQVLPSWSFFLPHSPSPVDLYALANTAASGGFTNPMTTLGDLITGGASGAAARLAGNTTGAREFLVSLGSGGLATAPAWSALQAGDIPALPYDASGAAAAAQGNAEAYAAAQAAAAQAAAEAAGIPLSQKGAASGVATLDSGSHVPAAQLPAATTGAQGAVILDGTAADIRPVPGVAAAGTIGKPADAGHVHPWQPWQFPITKYGAKIDGIMITDAAMGTGSTTLTSASAPFTSADAGKHICVNNAGPDPTRSGSGSNPSGALFTTISAYNSATSVTLAAANASGSPVSGSTAVYGTDDTAACQSAMAALSAYSGFAGQPYYAELVKDKPGICVLASMPVPGGAGGTTYGNAQIPLPVVDLTGTLPKPTVVIRDLFDNSIKPFWQQSIPQLGSCFFSMIEVTNANHNDATYGPVSVIGGPNVTAPFTHNYNNVLVVLSGVRVICPVNPGQVAVDFYLMCQFAIRRCSIDVFASVTGTPAIGVTGSGPSNTNGQGLRVNYTGLNDRCDIDSLDIEGYRYGMSLDEHVACWRLAIIYTNTAIYIGNQGAGRLTHAAWIGYASLEICQYCVYSDSSGSTSLFGLVIDVLDNEGGVTAHIYDPGNSLTGSVNVLPSGSQGLPVPTLVTGAANLEILSLAQPRGNVTAPSVPATTVALQNPFWRHAFVIITGGNVAGISIDGQATGLTSGPVIVPSGKTITLTYSAAPAWTWWLM